MLSMLRNVWIHNSEEDVIIRLTKQKNLVLIVLPIDQSELFFLKGQSGLMLSKKQYDRETCLLVAVYYDFGWLEGLPER